MTENKSSKWPERDSYLGLPDCESNALTTRLCCLPCPPHLNSRFSFSIHIRQFVFPCFPVEIKRLSYSHPGAIQEFPLQRPVKHLQVPSLYLLHQHTDTEVLILIPSVFQTWQEKRFMCHFHWHAYVLQQLQVPVTLGHSFYALSLFQPILALYSNSCLYIPFIQASMLESSQHYACPTA